MSNYHNEVLFTSTSRDMVNSDHVLRVVPVPERSPVMLRAGYLSGTGWRPSDAVKKAVNEWRMGHLSMWR